MIELINYLKENKGANEPIFGNNHLITDIQFNSDPHGFIKVKLVGIEGMAGKLAEVSIRHIPDGDRDLYNVEYGYNGLHTLKEYRMNYADVMFFLQNGGTPRTGVVPFP